MRLTVRCFENVTGRFAPYTPGDLLVERVVLSLSVREAEAYEEAWVIGNRQAADSDGQRWPRTVRSMSVGDVVFIEELGEWSAVAPVGFDPIERPDDFNVITRDERPTDEQMERVPKELRDYV